MTLLLEFWPKAYVVPKDCFPKSDCFSLCPPLSSRDARPLLNFFSKGCCGAKGHFFKRLESYALWWPLPPRDKRPFSKFLPKTTMVPKEGILIIEARESPSQPTQVPKETCGHFLNLDCRQQKGQRKPPMATDVPKTCFSLRPESYPLRQPLPPRDVRPLF